MMTQNLTPLEIKTIVTRVSENTKIVFTGPTQIDNIWNEIQAKKANTFFILD